MLFEDKDGKILTMEEVNNLMLWELDERRIHSYRENHFDSGKFDFDGFSNLNLNDHDYNSYPDVIDDDDA